MIRLSKSSIGVKEKIAVQKVLEHEYLGMGKEVYKFENKLKNFFHREVVCVSSGTSALQIAIQACNFKKNSEIIFPTITYISSYQAIIANGCIPVPCDIDEKNMLLDTKKLLKQISKKTVAIMPVHYSGSAENINQIYKIAKKYKIRVIEDAAHAFGSYHKKSLVGSFGDIACFSFDGIKNITCGEGGCIVTNDKKVINESKDARLLGVIKDSEGRYAQKRTYDFDVKKIGWRYHMQNTNAVIGIEQLKKIDRIKLKRQNLCLLYDSLLSKVSNIKIFKRDYKLILPHIYVVKLNKKINRDNVRNILKNKGIETGIHYKPFQELSISKKYLYKKKYDLTKSSSLYKSIITLPLHCDLKSKDIIYVVKSLQEAIS